MPYNEIINFSFSIQQILQAEEDGNQAVLDPLLVSDFTIVRASGVRQDRQTFWKMSRPTPTAAE